MNLTINLYWQQSGGETVGQKIDEILAGLEHIKKEPVEDAEMDQYDYAAGCLDEDTEWGYVPEEDEMVERYWDADQRSELEIALDEIGIAQQVLQDNCPEPAFARLQHNLLVNVINRVRGRIEKEVQEQKGACKWAEK